MRKSIALLSVLISPAMAAAAPLCALPAPAVMPPALHASTVDTPASTTAQPQPGSTSGPPLPAALANIPFATHVASSGATLIDLGASHGLHAIGARSGDQFMLFDMTPDGEAAVSGAPIELSVGQLQSIAGGNITELGAQHGLAHPIHRTSRPQTRYVFATNMRTPRRRLASSCFRSYLQGAGG